MDRSSASHSASLEEARAAYPGIGIPEATYFAHIEGKLAALGEGAAPSALRLPELYIACAAGHRDANAILYVERDTFSEIDAAYRRFPDCPITLDDIKQRLREKLFLADPPSILGYAGTGSLRGWVRAAALHLLLNVVHRETREQPSDDELFDVVIGDEATAESAYVKLACKEELEAALSFAMSELSDRDKSLLRHAFVDRRNVDEVAAIYSVHRATAARWIAAARRELVEHTRADLMRRLVISDAEAKSIIAAALSGVGSMLLAKLSRPTSK